MYIQITFSTVIHAVYLCSPQPKAGHKLQLALCSRSFRDPAESLLGILSRNYRKGLFIVGTR
jgi:hypothetical protein